MKLFFHLRRDFRREIVALLFQAFAHLETGESLYGKGFAHLVRIGFYKLFDGNGRIFYERLLQEAVFVVILADFAFYHFVLNHIGFGFEFLVVFDLSKKNLFLFFDNVCGDFFLGKVKGLSRSDLKSDVVSERS